MNRTKKKDLLLYYVMDTVRCLPLLVLCLFYEFPLVFFSYLISFIVIDFDFIVAGENLIYYTEANAGCESNKDESFTLHAKLVQILFSYILTFLHYVLMVIIYEAL